MGKDNGNALGSPTVILMGIGAVLDIILFYLMFKFADQGNLFMVLLTAVLIGVVALGITKGLAYISRYNYDK